MAGFEIAVELIFGLIIGSFLSVCIYRIPIGRFDSYVEGNPPEDGESDLVEKKEQISIGYPARSFCPKCRNQLSWYHNIPLFSWLFLRGRCAFCKEKISARYPAVELLTALMSVASFQMYGLTPTGFLIFAFCAALIVISFIDYDYFIIPNVISYPGFILGIIVAGVNQWTGIFKAPVSANLMDAFWGVLAGAGFLLLVSEVYMRLRKKEGLGMGDVKLLAMTGAFFGPEGSLYTIFIGSFLGSVLGILLVLCVGRKMSQALPFGPYLALGTIAYLFAGNQIVLKVLEVFSGR